MSTFEITAELRAATGKGVARKLRAAGRIPAVLYSTTQESTALTIDPEDLERMRRQPLGWNTPVQLSVDGLAGVRLVMVKEIQRHPVSRRALHVDFHHILEDRPVLVDVEVIPEGRAKGIELGGRLNLMRRAIRVRCLPALIPASVVVDISDLDVGQSVMVDELTLPDGVEAVYDQRFPLMAVTTKGAKGGELPEDELEDEGEDAEGEGEDAEAEGGDE